MGVDDGTGLQTEIGRLCVGLGEEVARAALEWTTNQCAASAAATAAAAAAAGATSDWIARDTAVPASYGGA